jgi:hypothetical protein
MTNYNNDLILSNLLQEKEALEGETSCLREELAQKTLRLQQVSNAIAALTGNFPKQNNWTSSSLQCIQIKDEFLQTNDILLFLFENTPSDLAFENRRRNYLISLSLALNNLCNSGRLIKIVEPGVKGHFYGLTSWVVNGQIKPEYDIKLQDRLTKMHNRRNTLPNVG